VHVPGVVVEDDEVPTRSHGGEDACHAAPVRGPWEGGVGGRDEVVPLSTEGGRSVDVRLQHTDVETTLPGDRPDPLERPGGDVAGRDAPSPTGQPDGDRSEEHTSELQSRFDLV